MLYQREVFFMFGFLRLAFAVTVLIPSLSWCSDGLWDKALHVASENSKWVPGLMTTETQIKDKKGKVKNSSEVTIELKTDEQGEIIQHLVRVLEDGEVIAFVALLVVCPPHRLKIGLVNPVQA